jgi:hypothetical protein
MCGVDNKLINHLNEKYDETEPVDMWGRDWVLKLK